MMRGERDPEINNEFEDMDSEEYLPSDNRRPTNLGSFALTYDRDAEQIRETEIPDSVRQTIFEHPRVKEAVRNSEKAETTPLSDPVVQQQMLSVCYERHPEVSEVAPAAIAQWGQDPAAHRAAQAAAGISAVHPAIATLCIGDESSAQTPYINQESAAIQAVAFGCGVGCLFMSLFPLVNPVVLFTHPAVWVMHAYQLIFSSATVVFEAKQQWLSWFKALDRHKKLILANVQMLASALGRGLFYIFQGVLWLCMGYAFPGHDRHSEENANIANTYLFIATLFGIFMVLIGVAHLLMHFEILPEDYASAFSRLLQTMSERIQGFVMRMRGSAPSARDAVTVTQASNPQVELSSAHRSRRGDVVESF